MGMESIFRIIITPSTFTYEYSGSAPSVNYNEEYQGTFTSQGSITVRLDDDGTHVIPGLEFCFVFIAIAIAIVIKKRKKQDP
jgi:hypothetical protein